MGCIKKSSFRRAEWDSRLDLAFLDNSSTSKFEGDTRDIVTMTYIYGPLRIRIHNKRKWQKEFKGIRKQLNRC